MTAVRDYILKHIKVIIPIFVIAVVAAAVSIVLSAVRDKDENLDPAPTEGSILPEKEGVTQEPEVYAEVPLVPNEDADIYSLVATYYNATGQGDLETLQSVFDELSETDLMRYEENAKYLHYYSALDVYTMPGVEEGTTLAYVYYKVVFENHEEEIPGFRTLYICEDGQGGHYIKNEKNFTQEETDYIKKVIEQENVILLYNRVQVEYNELMEEHPELLKYVGALAKTVEVAIGESLAEQIAAAEEPEEEPADTGDNGETAGDETPSVAEPAGEEGPRYATATATVNVRSSDSEQADKLGKVSSGTRLQVQEVRVNGWTKVLYEGKDGYIKSDYLSLEESTDELEVIGTVTASQNINIRVAASTEAESLGILAGGESLDLFANEGEWCKVRYNNRVAYVKSDYVTQ